MAEIFDFGFQKYRLKLNGVYNQNGLFAVVGDTARRVEVQLLDAAGRVTDTTGIDLSLSTAIGQSSSYVDATLIDANKGLYQVDLTNGLFLKPGKQDFQWKIYKDGKQINSVISRWYIDKSVSEGGNQSFNFYLNADDLKRKIEELEVKQNELEVKQDEIKIIQSDAEAENAAMISETESMQQEIRDIQQDFVDDTVESEALRISVEQSVEERYRNLEAEYAQDLSKLKQNDEEQLVQLEKRLTHVTYDMFKLPGLSDEEVIRATHLFANEHGLDVISLNGEFWLDEGTEIPIETNVDWGNTVFHINENAESGNHFVVRSKKPSEYVTLDETKKQSLLNSLKKGTTHIPALAPYSNSLVRVIDKNTQVGARYHEDQFGASWDNEDFFYVGDGGKLEGEVVWDFDDYTAIHVIPAEESYLTIQGGTFLLNGEGNPQINDAYKSSGFHITRSRTIVKNQFVGLDEGKQDDFPSTHTASNGFYSYSMVYDLAFDNIRNLPRVADTVTNRGTYGFQGSNVLGLSFNNVRAIGSNDYWGIMGNNKIKDLSVTNSHLTGVDVHFDAWNVTVKDSVINRLSLNGGGLLLVENVVVHGNSVVGFRGDYGSTWDGDINIKNVTVYPTEEKRYSAILAFSPRDFDYLYDTACGTSITIENVAYDFVNAPNNDYELYVINFPNFGKFTDSGRRISFPSYVNVKNIRVRNNEAGNAFQLFDIRGTINFKAHSNGGINYLNGTLDENTIMMFDNIDCKLFRTSDRSRYDNTSVYLSMDSDVYTFPPENTMYSDSLYPKIVISNCKNLSVNLRTSPANIIIKDSVVNYFTVRNNEGLIKPTSFFHLVRCTLAFDISSTLTANRIRALIEQFTNCSFELPKKDGEPITSLAELSLYFSGIVDFTTHYVYGIHVGTRLTEEFKNFIELHGTTPPVEFYQKLNSHNSYQLPNE